MGAVDGFGFEALFLVGGKWEKSTTPEPPNHGFGSKPPIGGKLKNVDPISINPMLLIRGGGAPPKVV